MLKIRFQQTRSFYLLELLPLKYSVRNCFVYIMANNRGETLEEQLESIKMQAHESSSSKHHIIELDHDTFTRPGAQLSDKQAFTNKKGQSITGYPVIVDFRRLLQLCVGHSQSALKDNGIIHGVAIKLLFINIHYCIYHSMSISVIFQNNQFLSKPESSLHA